MQVTTRMFCKRVGATLLAVLVLAVPAAAIGGKKYIQVRGGLAGVAGTVTVRATDSTNGELFCVSIDIGAASTKQQTADSIVAGLNADAAFSANYTAVKSNTPNPSVFIRNKAGALVIACMALSEDLPGQVIALIS